MGVIKYMSILTTFSIFAALLSILYQALNDTLELNKIATIMGALIVIENVNRTTPKPTVAVGYGACTDLIIPATIFLNYTKEADDIDENFTIDDITNYKEFIQSFTHYFSQGAAAERFTPDEHLFRNLIQIAVSNYKNVIRWELGGNAPIMGLRLHKEGANVLLASRISKKFQNRFPKGIKMVGDDLNAEDDIHLILEYKTEDEFGPHKAPRANRYILHNDKNNPQLVSLEEFGKALNDFNPKLIVVSGLQMMDSYKFSEGFRESRLSKLQNQITSQPYPTLVHFEMASYVELELIKQLSTIVFPYIDSLGMNEQELYNLEQFYSKGKISFAADSNPRVAVALDQMRGIFTKINQDYFDNKSDTKRKILNRIHIHTLAYQAILVVNGSQWTNTQQAAAKSALTAHRYVCQTNIINPESTSLILDDSFATSANGFNYESGLAKRIKLDSKYPVPCWTETQYFYANGENYPVDYVICLSPVLVCKSAKKTAGAGDNISASALAMQIM